MLIGWNRGHFLLITRALLVNQDGMITWFRLANHASAVSWFSAETRWNEFWKSLERNAKVFKCNYFINCERKSACRNECAIHFPQPEKKKIIWTAERWKSWRLSFKDKFLVVLCIVWYSKQRPPYRMERAEDLLVLTVLAVERTEGSLKKFLRLVRTLFTNFIDWKFSISTPTKQASQTKVTKLKPFTFICKKM